MIGISKPKNFLANTDIICLVMRTSGFAPCQAKGRSESGRTKRLMNPSLWPGRPGIACRHASHARKQSSFRGQKPLASSFSPVNCSWTIY